MDFPLYYCVCPSSFSKVKRTVTAACAHVNEDHSEALMMLETQRDKTPSIDEATDSFVAERARRLHTYCTLNVLA